MGTDFLFEGLNENQKKAVLHKDGPLLVLAGAGAGKTRAISHRVAYLVHSGVEPEKILAITFTNKAAAEMRERISDLLRKLNFSSGAPPSQSFGRAGSPTNVPFISTFHSLGVSLLKKHGSHVGVPKNFSIFDQGDSLGLIKEAVKELDLDEKQFQPSRIQNIISRYKGDLITNDAFRETVGDSPPAGGFPRILSQVWDKYEAGLVVQKALDFDDLILKTFLLLKNNTEARNFYQEHWQYVLIDEYQDTNKGQYEISKLLAAKHKNICIIGDIDQAIYSWRGADFKNIINFERDFPEHTSIVFEENYRSTKNILDAAAKIIERNKMRKPKNVIAIKSEGAELSLFEAMNEKEEAEFVIHTIKEILAEQRIGASEIAILYRANFQSRVFEEEFLKHRLPYQVLGTRFYDRKEVKDIFSFIRAALNPDSLVDIKRVINVPPRGIGKTSVLNFFAKKKLPTEMQKKFDEFLNNLAEIKNAIEKETPSDVIRFIMKKTGYQDYLNTGSEDDKERLENLMELVSIASKYDEMPIGEGIEKLVTDASLMSDQDSLLRNKDAVRLMTAHSAKGLEFEYVFIVGLEDGLFPHSGFGARDPNRDEEERRLFYVALTRAKEKLFLTFSVSRMVFGARQMNMPSRFLSDIPEHLLKVENHEREQEYIEYL